MKPTNTNCPEFFHKIIDCQYACPAHTPVPEYIRLIARQEYDKAYAINWLSNVLPGVLGRICDRPCEPACRRGRIEKEPVAICRLKRLAADQKTSLKEVFPDIPKEKNGKKIALIGGGPASLTVARDLMPLGYEVHLFDNQKKAGGFIRSQVPSFRLPEEVLDEEVDCILDMGVICHMEHYVESLKEMLAKDFDAIFVGTGAPKGRDLQLKGREEGKEFIHVSLVWLASILYQHVHSIGKRVLIIGGGNTAMDCCRTALRLGGEQVSVVIRSAKKDMKASPWEIEDALHEGIDIIENHNPIEFVVEDGVLQGVLFEKMTTKYENGKEILQSLDEEPVFIACDEVILAVGQQNAFPWIEDDLPLKKDEWGQPIIDPKTLASSIEGLFFGGDAAFGARNAITAIAHGHKAAISIDLFCQGKDFVQDRPPAKVHLDNQKMGLNEWAYDSSVTDTTRQQMPTADMVRSLQDRLLEVELGFTKSIGYEEAMRCLNCDVQTIFEADKCIECDACVDICPVFCLNFTEIAPEKVLRSSLKIPAEERSCNDELLPLYVSPPVASGRIMVKDENVCLHCGLCADRCPTAAWEMKKFTYSPAITW